MSNLLAIIYIICLVLSTVMFDTVMFLLSFDTDYIGWNWETMPFVVRYIFFPFLHNNHRKFQYHSVYLELSKYQYLKIEAIPIFLIGQIKFLRKIKKKNTPLTLQWLHSVCFTNWYIFRAAAVNINTILEFKLKKSSNNIFLWHESQYVNKSS